MKVDRSWLVAEVSRMKGLPLLKRIIYLGAAAVLALVGLLGLVLPIIPGVVLLLLAANLVSWVSPEWGRRIDRLPLMARLKRLQAGSAARLKTVLTRWFGRNAGKSQARRFSFSNGRWTAPQLARSIALGLMATVKQIAALIISSAIQVKRFYTSRRRVR